MAVPWHAIMVCSVAGVGVCWEMMTHVWRPACWARAGCRCRVKLMLSAVTSPVHKRPVSQSSIPGPGLVSSSGASIAWLILLKFFCIQTIRYS